MAAIAHFRPAVYAIERGLAVKNQVYLAFACDF
jgi:hypothetical protein